MSSATVPETGVWHPVCAIEDIIPNSGVAALLGRRQIAVLRVVTRDGDEQLYAVSNFCPFSRAMVLSRGFVGSKGGVPKVVSPVYKQSFDLRSGQCLDDPAVGIPTYRVRCVEGQVEVAL